MEIRSEPFSSSTKEVTELQTVTETDQATNFQKPKAEIEVEQIATRGFRQTKAPPAEIHYVVEMTVRGTWLGAPAVRIGALEVKEVGSTGPYHTTELARKLWLENENLVDDHFERILVGMDQMFKIMSLASHHKPMWTQSESSNSKLGRVIGGPSQEKSTKQNQSIVSQLIFNSNLSLPQTT